MIQALKIGNLIFPNNLIQGPLAGVSSAPFRVLASQYGKPAYTYTEMISAKTLIDMHNKKRHRLVKISADEGPICFQIAGQNSQELGLATKIATDLGANIIDLNCGCPVNKIRARGMGSKLLITPDKIAEIIEHMKLATHLPISIKIRVDGFSNEHCNEALVKMLNQSGIDVVVVHGRHWTEDYTVKCHYQQIKFFVDALTMPVIGNGDICDLASLKRMLETGCDAAMIARASVGQPFLFQQLIKEMNEETFVPIAQLKIKAMLIEHVQSLINLLENEFQAILQARKFAKYYARNLIKKESFSEAIKVCESFKTLTQICNHYF